MTKLTLSVDEVVIEQAKQIAEDNGTSVSAMFTQFVRSLAGSKRSAIRPGRIARQASGLIDLPGDKDYKELISEALMERYGVTE